MAAMQFRDYVWQNDPESLRIRFRREYKVEPRSDGLWRVTNIARILAVPEDAVNVKATTEEKLGFTGSGEGISAYAVAGIESREKQ